MMNHRQNNPALFRPTTTNSQGRAEMETGTRRKPAAIGGGAAECKRNSRRALGLINQNLVGSTTTNQTGYPCIVTKRALTQECVIYDENSGYPVKRPITRKFAAQVQHNQLNQQIPPQPQKENKKPDDDVVEVEIPIQNSKKVEDTKIIDVNEEEEDSDSTSSTDLQPMPMSPETAIGGGGAGDTKMEEVEMEDIFEEAVLDIDGCDAKNPLAVADYVVDLYTYYRKMEQGCSLVSPDYMSNQFDINHKMRAILIDWLIEVHYKFELRDETLFLTVNLIDRFLARQSVLRKKLQLVGLVALLLACKYEEVSVPVVEDLIFISDKAYSRKDILDMEKLMVNTLQFNLSLPTPYVFMTRFLKAAESDKKLELLSFFLIELALVEYEMLRFSPSLLAASAVYTAQCAVYGFKQWNKTCEWYSTYSEDQLMECSRLIVGLHETAATGKLTGVHRKYSTSKFGHAAKFSPAKFLLEETEET